MTIKGDLIELEGILYKTIPEDKDNEDNCEGCHFKDNDDLCDQIKKENFINREDLFCTTGSIVYQLADISKGKRKLLIL